VVLACSWHDLGATRSRAGLAHSRTARAEAGVLGVLPGIVGSIQAVEVIKLILGIGDSLSGRLLAYDSLEQSFRTYRMLRDPQCPACSIDPADIVIAEYDELCMPHPIAAPSPAAAG
jgi:sulfur-carrier protein adenylyltransferase/sulfurtransferase